MTKEKVPFYTQTAVLDRYIHASDLSLNMAAVELILRTLQARPDLRSYFFRSGPSAAWADILWDKGFLKVAPLPEQHKDGYIFPRWDEQEYLLSVADQAPEIVIKHVRSIKGSPIYLARAVEALRYIPVEIAETAVSQVIEWLKDKDTAIAIASYTYELMAKLANENRADTAFALFKLLTRPLPIPSDDQKRKYFIAKADSVLIHGWNDLKEIKSGIETLQKLDLQRLCSILENHLCTALSYEAAASNHPDFEFASWWRRAIEETGQDNREEYKDLVLAALRDSLEIWAQEGGLEFEELLQRYLTEQYEILRRLAFYIFWKYPERFHDFVVTELLRSSNLDDGVIHHEFFMLLRHGFEQLLLQDRQSLISSICAGPSVEKAQTLADWAQKEFGEEREEYIKGYTKVWIRDRLWMLKDYLAGEVAQTLEELVTEIGEPEHPAFTGWTSGAYMVSDVSPITVQEISALRPQDLLGFLKRWHPDPKKQFGPNRVSYRGLADMVAQVILSYPRRYEESLVGQIALLRPEFAYSFFHPSSPDSLLDTATWKLRVSVCQRLLREDEVRQDMTRQSEIGWIDVRQALIRFLESSMEKMKKAIPPEDLPKVRDLLLILIDDPDPTSESDRPGVGWLGHKDPATLALNTVRPSALLALIAYASLRAELETSVATEDSTKESHPSRIEEIVKDALTRKLNRNEDTSWAVHSVYGRHLSLLYWLDQEWLLSHLGDIFPEGDDEDTVWFYVAAWDSYVIFNRFLYMALFEILRPQYERAIENLGMGYTTDTHLHPVEGLASHLLLEYRLSNYDLGSVEGQNSLIRKFFEKALPDDRGHTIWMLWFDLNEHPEKLETFWPRGRALWQWRLQVASAANHSVEFLPEMRWFARLALIASKSETIVSLWPLLEGLIPYVNRSEYRDILWDSLEEYLAKEVERDPVRTIQFYRLMYSRLKKVTWFEHKEARKILVTAANHQDSRQEALSLIDLIARLGYHGFRDIYEQATD